MPVCMMFPEEDRKKKDDDARAAVLHAENTLMLRNEHLRWLQAELLAALQDAMMERSSAARGGG